MQITGRQSLCEGAEGAEVAQGCGTATAASIERMRTSQEEAAQRRVRGHAIDIVVRGGAVEARDEVQDDCEERHVEAHEAIHLHLEAETVAEDFRHQIAEWEGDRVEHFVRDKAATNLQHGNHCHSNLEGPKVG
eukprot:CAMPEP_0174735166 /NCGR_PEP_ID=MMETSP1094-20130205/64503_1 /TAXON_ID=156173 /ORGANISM="Chrysochromulina brevifilum, Strain UTEX LB 985" /LENGTH=133 /DNA_ID=CAMNT_0015938095 /DNA_START=251 /DNA_END=653 /DNA_ORIENTATION=-